MWSGDCKPTMYLFSLLYYMGCVKITSLATLLSMRLCLLVVLRHVGDIAASRAVQVGIRAFPDLRSPIAWSLLVAEMCLEKCFESFRNYISEILGILFTSQTPHRSGKASWRRVLTLLFSNFTKNIFRIMRVSWNRSDGFMMRTLSWCLLSGV